MILSERSTELPGEGTFLTMRFHTNSSLGKAGRLPGPGSIIASSYTSPLDVLYLAAIFDPIFTQSFQGSREVQVLSLERALASCFSLPPPKPADTISLAELVAANRRRVIVVFPECTTSNGKGVLRLSQSLLSASKGTNIFPVSLRYSPADVVTPIPGFLESIKFVWTLFSRQTHSIRVRVGFPVKMAQLQQQQPPPSSIGASQKSQRPQVQHALSSSSDKDSEEDQSSSRPATGTRKSSGYDTNFFDNFPPQASSNSALAPAQKVGESGLDGLSSDGDDDDLFSTSSSSSAVGGKRPFSRLSSVAERQSLEIVAESLSRLGRVKTLGLGVEEKIGFVEAWQLGGKGSARKGASKKIR
jgi:1-acyl-sn-glycerol-3-phosphate acyltransferase